MNAGRFDTLVEIWRYTSSQNSYGEPVKEWTKAYDAYAKIDYFNGTEAVNGEQWENKQNQTIYIRHISDLSVKDRVKHGNLYLNIISISEMDRRMYQKLQCKEVI